MPGESTSHVIGSPRRLAAILAADIAGYSRLMGHEEEGTLARLKRHRREIVEPTLQEHYGRVIKNTGDGFLAVFDSPLEAVRCAIVIQQMMAARNTSLPPSQWIQYRIGVNLGDVIVDDDDIYGEGVNIAARLETIAEPGGVFISGGVYEQIKNKLVCGYQSLGDERLKNITDPVRIYRVLPDPAAVQRAARSRRRTPAIIAASAAGLACVGWLAYTFNHVPDAPKIVQAPPAAAGARAALAPAVDTTATGALPQDPLPEPTAAAAAAPEPVSAPAEPARPPAATGASATLPGLPKPPAAPGDALPIAIPQSAPSQDVALLVPPAPSMAPPKPGATFRDCANCPELVSIPGGSFRMGSQEDPTELPIRQVSIEPFALGRYPVTVSEWNRCAADKACGFAAEGDAASPVRNLSWNDAKAYVDWLARVTGKPYRLPSEAEWEYAARAGTTGRYWWGDKVLPKMANCRGCGPAADSRQPVKVGTLPSNPFGLHEMTGNVAQWVADCWFPDYRGAPDDGAPRQSGACREHVLRGGSWRNDASYARSASRTYYDTGVRYPAHGLRVARSF